MITKKAIHVKVTDDAVSLTEFAGTVPLFLPRCTLAVECGSRASAFSFVMPNTCGPIRALNWHRASPTAAQAWLA